MFGIFTRTSISALFLCFALLALSAEAAPGINPEIPFHGVLKDDLGDPLTGSYDMTFVIYDAPSGGTALWTGLYTVDVTEGTFKVMLGSGGSTFGALDFTDDTYYIGLTVEADAEMTPRQRIGASAYAFNADKLDGYDATDFLNLSASTSMATTSATTLFTLTQNGGGDILNLFSGASPVFTVNSTGMVGVGTDSPGSPLDVKSSGFSTVSGIRLENRDDSNIAATIYETSAGVGTLELRTNNAGFTGAQSVRLTASGTSYFNGGNIGIGTTEPTAKLTISGNTSTLPPVPTAGTNIHLGGADSGQLSLTMDGFSAAPVIIGRRSSGTAGSPSALGFAGYNLLLLQTSGYGATGYSAPSSAFAVVTDEGWTDSAQGTEIRMYTTPNGSTTQQQRLTINNDGNVGIGTSTPAYKLDTIGFINTDQYSGYKQAGNTVLYASTSNVTLAVGASLAAEWMSASSTPWYSVAIGQGALATTPASSTAQLNTAIGYNALTSNTTGYYNTANGVNALYYNTAGYYNTANGVSALQANTTGYYNTANGLRALLSNTTGHSNTANGLQALFYNTTGYQNTASGMAALFYNTAATNSTAIGYSAAIGTAAYSNQGGVYLGYQSGRSASTGSDYNTLIGYQSGYGVTTGARNVLIGQSTIAASYNQVTTGSNNIAIGNDVAVASSTASNQLNIGNIIFGTGLTGSGSTIAGNIGIGTTSPSSKFDVWGNFNVATSATSTLFVNTGSGRVGIGTSSPSALLHVTKPSGLATNILAETIVGNAAITLKAGNASWSPFTSSSYDYFQIWSETAAATAFHLGTSGNVSLGTYAASGVPAPGGGLLASGKVGFGSSSPSALLSVASTTVSGTTQILTLATTSPIMTVLANGSVGIGTLNPASIHTFQVNSSGTGQAAFMYTGTPSASGGGTIANLVTQIPDATDQRLGSLVFGYNNSGQSTTNRNAVAITAYTSQAWTPASAQGASLRFETTPNDSATRVERMRITEAGNVGIGSTTPSARLAVNGAATPTGSELVTNGTFTGDASGWTLGDCASYGANQVTVTYTACADPSISADVETVAGTTYLLTFTLSNVQEDKVGYYFTNNAINYGFPSLGNGTHTFAFTTDYTGTETITFSPISGNEDGSWTIDDVSIKVAPTTPALAITGFDGSSWLTLGGDYLYNNTALGKATLARNTTGYQNTAIGEYALSQNEDGYWNTAVGHAALYSNTSGTGNTANGVFALHSNTLGAYNDAFGWKALFNNTTGNGNTAIGNGTLMGNTMGGENVAVGGYALSTNTEGNNNVAVGVYALLANTTGLKNTALGYQTMYTSTEGNENNAIGYQAMYGNLTGSQNNAIGYQAMYGTSMTGSYNNAIGESTLFSNTEGSENNAIGRWALYANTTGTDNNAIGSYALRYNTSGTNNSALGRQALLNNTIGSYNVASGESSLFFNTTGSYNVGLGRWALYSNTVSDQNTAVGSYALANATGTNVTALGYRAGTTLTLGSGNTFLGAYTDSLTSDISSSTAIGAGALVECSNCLVLGGTGANAVKVGIGTSSPSSPLNVRTTEFIGIKLENPEGATQISVHNNNNTRAGFGMLAYSTSSDPHLFSDKGLFASSKGFILMTDGDTGEAGTSEIEFRTGGYRTNNMIMRMNRTGIIIGKNFTTPSTTPPTNGLLVEGNVGIGTTSPNAILTVANTINTTAGTPLFTIASTTGGTSTSTLFSVLSSGYVGVGTVAPRMPLEIAKSAPSGFSGVNDLLYLATSYDNAASPSPDGFGPGIRFRSNLNTGQYRDVGRVAVVRRGSSSVSDIIFSPTPDFSTLTEVMRVGGDGKVGIGTTTPTSALTFASSTEVAGGITMGDVNLFRSAPDTLATEDSLVVLGATFGITGFYGNLSGGTSVGGDLTIDSTFDGTKGDIYLNPSGGNVGIGTTTPTEELTVVGTIQATNLLGSATNITTDANGNIIRDPSDERLKENIEPLENSLEKLLELRGVSYEWKDEGRFGNQKEIGFIAQEVDLVLPEVVQKGGEYWSLNKANMLAVVVEAVKEMYAMMLDLSTKVADLLERDSEKDEEIETLEARVRTLEELLDVDVPAELQPEPGEPTPPAPEETEPAPGGEIPPSEEEPTPEEEPQTVEEPTPTEESTPPEEPEPAPAPEPSEPAT